MKLSNILNKKFLKNINEYCDKKNHPLIFYYRAYRRGKNRCLECGAKVGKVKLKLMSYSEMIFDNVSTGYSILKCLKET